MGAMINILPIYARPFWREQGLNGLGSGDLPFLELTADSGPPEGQPAVLAGFVIPGTWTGPARLAAANHGRVIWGAARFPRDGRAISREQSKPVNWRPPLPWAN